MVVPIARKQQAGKITTIELDTAGLPPMVATKLRLRAVTSGLYELAAGDDELSELFATPAAAAELDVVVRVCKQHKVPELDFAN